MAVTYGFFNSVSGDRKYNAEQIGRYLHGLISSGVYADQSDSLQVLSTGGMAVAVQPGRAMLDFHFLENDAPLELTLETGDSLPRYDAIILKVSETDRACSIEIKKGTAATAPTAPAMTRNDATKEYMLAKVYVNKLASTITQAAITDTRADNTVCGWVTGIISQVDTSTLFAQWQQAYEDAYAKWEAETNAYFAQKQAEFETWFSALSGELRVETYIQEYKNVVKVQADDTYSLTIGISDYNSAADVLIANINGVVFTENEDYTISGTGESAVFNLVRPIRAGNTVEFRVLKSVIGSRTV